MKETLCKSCEFVTLCNAGRDSLNGSKVKILGCSRYEKKPIKTNADMLRVMSDEDLARGIAKLTDRATIPQYNGKFMAGNYDVILEWLKQEVKE